MIDKSKVTDSTHLIHLNCLDIGCLYESVVSLLSFEKLQAGPEDCIALQGQHEQCIICRCMHDALYYVFSCL